MACELGLFRWAMVLAVDVVFRAIPGGSEAKTAHIGIAEDG